MTPKKAETMLEVISNPEPKKPEIMYTLVRHSSWQRTSNEEFEHAVEETAISGAMVGRVRAADGLVFEHYREAYDAAIAYNYPPENKSLTPTAVGSYKDVGPVRQMFVPSDPEAWKTAK